MLVRGALMDGGRNCWGEKSVSVIALTGTSPKACAFRAWLVPQSIAQLRDGRDHEILRYFSRIVRSSQSRTR